MQHDQHFCGTAQHDISRRAFLSTLGLGTMGLLGSSGAAHSFMEPGLSSALKTSGKRVILLWLAGGPSPLGTWGPKPGRPTGGAVAGGPPAVPGGGTSQPT